MVAYFSEPQAAQVVARTLRGRWARGAMLRKGKALPCLPSHPLSDETKKFHRARYRDFFSRPNVFETDTETNPTHPCPAEAIAKVKK